MSVSPPAQVISSSKSSRSGSASTYPFKIHASNFVQKGIVNRLDLMKILPTSVYIYLLSAFIWWLIVIYLHMLPTWYGLSFSTVFLH